MTMKKRSWNWLKTVTVILILLIAMFLVKAVREIINRQEITKELHQLDRRIIELQTEQQELENLMTYLQSWDFIEKEARTRMNLRKEGERVIIIPQNSTGTPAMRLEESQLVTSTIQDLNNFEKWWQYVFPNKP